MLEDKYMILDELEYSKWKRQQEGAENGFLSRCSLTENYNMVIWLSQRIRVSNESLR